jgi:hypothetical protein
MSQSASLVIWRYLGPQIKQALQGLHRLECESKGPRSDLLMVAIHALQDVIAEFER